MKKKTLRFISTVLSATTLLSMLTTTSAVAVENFSTDSTQAQTSGAVNDENDSDFVGATGDRTLENPNLPEDATVIKSVNDYYKIKDKKHNLLRSGSSASLPESADNSQSKYFPEIDSQGSIGSCVAWAQAYYQFTYTMNKEMGVETTPENTFSPKFVYNNTNGAVDEGSSTENAYKFMEYQGNVPLSLVPYDDDYLSWSPTEEVWKTSIKYRVKDYQYFDSIGTEDSQITSADDSDLEAVKTALSNGDVLTFSTYVSSFVKGEIKENSDAPENSKYAGEEVVLKRSDSDGPHRMTLVGYNDNIWTDINENGNVDQGEMGAFKIANSWGSGYANDGFIWVAYDALNEESAVEGVSADSKRGGLMSFIARIDVMPYNAGGDLYFKYTWNSSNRRYTKAEVTAELDGTEYTASIYPTYIVGVSKGEYSYDGTTNSNDGTMVLALNNVLPQVTSENIEDCNWTVTFHDTESDGNVLTVKNAEIVDESTNKVYKLQNEYPFTLDGEEKILKLVETKLNNAVIYYRGYDKPDLHYKVNNGSLTSQQDVTMNYNIERRGYLYKYVIELEQPSDVTLWFSDKNGNVDNNNGQYYTAQKGLNYYITENVAQALTAEMNSVGDAISINKRIDFSTTATGGYEPYQYRYIYKNLDTGEEITKDYTDNPKGGNWFYTVGNYRITVNVKDYADNVVSASIDLYIEDKPFEYTEFTVTPSDKIMVGDTLQFNAVTNFETITYIGYPKNTHEFTIKNSAEEVIYTTSVRSEDYNLSLKTSVLELSWRPAKADRYSVTISSTDGSNEYAESTVYFEVADFAGSIIGDVNGDKTVSIKDATLIQKYIVDMISSSELWTAVADCNKDDIINIKDATCIQQYLASDGSYAYVGIVNEENPVVTEPTTEPTTAQPTTVQPTTVAKTNKVTFTNSLRWSGTIYCYYWSDSNTSMTTWPGKAMTNAGTNTYGETMYTFIVPEDATYIIFSNGSSQTTDISYSGGEIRYYPLSTTDSNGHNNVATW